MSVLDYVWRYDRVLLPVVAFVVGFVVANPAAQDAGTASVLESDGKLQLEFEQEYQQEIDSLKDELQQYEEDASELKTENGNLSEIIDEFSVDTDGDRLPDYTEESIGTDPKKKDTDGDGFDDMAEIRSGYSPLKAAGTATAVVSVPKVEPKPLITEAPPVTPQRVPGEECFIKGTSDKVYYLPGRLDYDSITDVEVWLCSLEEALNKGYRPPLK